MSASQSSLLIFESNNMLIHFAVNNEMENGVAAAAVISSA